MKTINYTFALICFLTANLCLGQVIGIEVPIEAEPVTNKACNTFESNTTEGWQELHSTISLDSPSMDNSTYLKADDRSGASYIYSNSFPSNWERYKGKCLCFDYKVFNDGNRNGVENINPKIMLMNGAHPINSSIRATFVANITITENDPWVHVCAPIMPSDGVNPPSNAQGQWTNVTAAEWDTLLANIGTVAFFVDVAGSAVQSEQIGVDNICITDCKNIVDPPSDEGAYCCEGENLVTNGNFENNSDNSPFISMYDNNSALFPGQYQITNSAAAFGASVTDHSYCSDPVQYANNNQFMVVNGRTQQSGSSVIWAQTISGLTEGKTYRFCANFKNMPQCTFDILPNINMEVSGLGSSGYSVINADPNDPCDWVNREFIFTATSNSVTISISLDETGNGDGNDLAIDDISVAELVEPELNITVQHQGNPQQITASINTIDISDDFLPIGDKCEYYWFTAKVNSFPPLDIDMNSFASGNNSGNDTGNGNSPWNLTTTFPNYNFDPNSMYIVGMYTPECGCYDEGITYQLTYNNRQTGDNMLSDQQKQEIIDRILNGRPSGDLGTNSNQNVSEKGLTVYPNPSKGNFNLSIQGDSLQNIEIFSITGQSVFTQSYSEGKVSDEIDISSFSSGIYIIKAHGRDGKQYNAKVIKE
ncbi:MAG TPA: T9SS type A sorting domain-containing protein [Aequorivita sp.]|nr:T9SS type A sorting domain-containing protein [Aequorivita sp.]